MSQEYLNRLLSSPEHRVQGECAICLEPYNTLNHTTGIIEAEIKLTCGHTVGSACIVTWLRDNNSCPLCRQTFFPRQPRPYLEHGVMGIGEQVTGRTNVTGSLTGEPHVIRSLTVAASSEAGSPSDSRTRIIDAGTQRRVRSPTGPEVRRSSSSGVSDLGRSSTIRGTTGSEVLTSSNTRNPNAGRSNAIGVPTGSGEVSTGSEALTETIVSGMRDLDTGGPRTDTTGFDISRMVDLPTEIVIPADRVATILGVIWGESASDTVKVAVSLAALMPERLQSQGSNYIGAVCFYMASHLLHRPKSAQEIARSMALSPYRILRVFGLVHPIRKSLIDAETWKLIARPEDLLTLLPPPDWENAHLDDGEQRIQEMQRQHAGPESLQDEVSRLCWNHYRQLGRLSVFTHCISICDSGVLERRLGRPSARLKVAIGLYIGANLLGIQASCQRVAHLVDISDNALTAAYVRIYPWAGQLLDSTMVSFVDSWNEPEPRERAFEVVPAWPPLEV